jgi:hypothetical protein
MTEQAELATNGPTGERGWAYAAQAAMEALGTTDDTSFLEANAISAFMGLPGYWLAAERWFGEANESAPQRGVNHLRWGQSLLRSGYKQDAKAQFDRARSVSLSVSDRAQLDTLLQ